MDKELELKIKSLKQKTFYEPVTIKGIDTSNEDYLTISGYVNKFKDATGQIIKDSDGDAVVPTGMDLTRFNKNPIILHNHNRDDVIGKATSVEVREDGLFMSMEIYKALNEKVYKAIKLGVLKSFSIGFMIEDLTYDEKSDIFYLTKTKLMENSVVTLGANEDSLLTTIDEHLAVAGKSVKLIVVKEPAETNLATIQDSIKALEDKINAALRVKEEENTPEPKNDDTEVPDGADDTGKEPEKEPEGASEVKEDEKLSLADEVNNTEVNEANFDELLAVQEALNARLNDFLRENLN